MKLADAGLIKPAVQANRAPEVCKWFHPWKSRVEGDRGPNQLGCGAPDFRSSTA